MQEEDVVGHTEIMANESGLEELYDNDVFDNDYQDQDQDQQESESKEDGRLDVVEKKKRRVEKLVVRDAIKAIRAKEATEGPQETAASSVKGKMVNVQRKDG